MGLASQPLFILPPGRLLVRVFFEVAVPAARRQTLRGDTQGVSHHRLPFDGEFMLLPTIYAVTVDEDPMRELP